MMLAKTMEDVFGRVTPPSGIGSGNNPGEDFGNALTALVQIIFFIAAIALLFYMLWGGLDWILAGGDKEKLEKARGKIRDAFLGIIILVFVLVLFVVIAGNVLHIIDYSQGTGIIFKIPRL